MSFGELRIRGASHVDIDRDVEIYLENNTSVGSHFFYDFLIIRVGESQEDQH